MTAEHIRSILRGLEDPAKARILQGFFKTGPGEYGEGDLFLGITVPQLRKVSKECDAVPIGEAEALLKSTIHEERLLALLILIRKYNGEDESGKKGVYTLYLKSTRWINNWDLVDLSAPNIVGDFLMSRNRRPLYRLAKSPVLWERRVAILATHRFIRERQFDDTLEISEILLRDKEDLIQKAVGWMLREVGKRDLHAEEGFLKEHYKQMPRTMLRYAIERFPAAKRALFMKGGM
ncbi:MAG: DNA alkylation repair protein [Deltaproteobacteria bacterium]|nr:DNA alkylation repair protein [Deltaproteobacteria bacterium]